MSKTVKMCIKLYSSENKKWYKKFIQTTEIKRLCKKSKLLPVIEAYDDLEEWYGIDEITDERMIEEIEHKISVCLGNFYDCKDTVYQINNRDMTEKEMFNEIKRTKNFVQKLKGVL